MTEPRRVVVEEMRNAAGPRPGFLAAFGRWFRRDFILRRLSLLVSAGCLITVFCYMLIHVIMLAPLLLLAVLAFFYGVSGRRAGAP